MDLWRASRQCGHIVASVAVAASALIAVALPSYGSPTFTSSTFHQFADASMPANGTDSGNPTLTLGGDGNYYGTTIDGGADASGKAYKLTPTGTYTFLHSFNDGTVVNDGVAPCGQLVLGPGGELYGVTCFGGGYYTKNSRGNGTAFKMTPAGAVTILHSFSDGSVANDGWCAEDIMLGRDGNFYGTTAYGGTADLGTVFKMTPSGAITIIHSFQGQAGDDGAWPFAGLIQGTDGYFYGTTTAGGTSNFGSIYRINPSGSSYTLLHSFLDGSTPFDGAYPTCNLVETSDGSFYGVTTEGGSRAIVKTTGGGTIFKMTPTHIVTTVHQFDDGTLTDDGYSGCAGLTLASDGNLYGTTQYGGASDLGAFFRLTPAGAYTLEYSFKGYAGNDALYPSGPIIQGSGGDFFGLACGGPSSYGNVYRVQPLFPPTVPTVSAVPGNEQVTLNWSAAGWATSYNVYRGTVSGDESTTPIAKGVVGLQFADTGLVNGTAYYFKVVAVNADGTSPKSIEVKSTPVPPDTAGLLLLQNSSTTQVAWWSVAGTKVTSSNAVSVLPGAGWKAVGSADFNGDGKPDLIFQNASNGNLMVWYMNGTKQLGTAKFVESPGPAWRVFGVGDFNNDGHPDLALCNAAGDVEIWFLNGTEVVYSGMLPETLDGWRAAGVGDVSGDGYVDILAQNMTTGQIAVWYMIDGAVIGATTLSGRAAAGWSLVAINGLTTSQALPNLVFQKAAEVEEYTMSSFATSSGILLSAVAPAGWTVVGPK